MFNFSIKADTFNDLARPLFYMWPPPPVVEQLWNLSKVLNILKTRRFTVNPSFADVMALALGALVGELHSLLRRRGFIVFGEHYSWVVIHPNPQFLLKNDTVAFQRRPLLY